jgi:1,4-alpha-glucan branching enzyme
VDSALYRIALFAPGAKVVELSADFTRWNAIALKRLDAGMWTVDVHVTPGTYRVNVRVDGGRWVAPAETPAVADDFGGTAGLVVVPDQ